MFLALLVLDACTGCCSCCNVGVVACYYCCCRCLLLLLPIRSGEWTSIKENKCWKSCKQANVYTQPQQMSQRISLKRRSESLSTARPSPFHPRFFWTSRNFPTVNPLVGFLIEHCLSVWALPALVTAFHICPTGWAKFWGMGQSSTITKCSIFWKSTVLKKLSKSLRGTFPQWPPSINIRSHFTWGKFLINCGKVFLESPNVTLSLPGNIFWRVLIIGLV